MKVPVPALKTATHRAAESALISLMTLKSHLLTDSFIFMWSRWKKMPHLPRKGELGLTAEEMCPNSKQESPCGNLPETLGPTVISPNLCPDSNSHSAIIRAFNMSQRSPRSNAWWKAYRSNQRFLIAAFPSFEVTWKELRRHSILWGKGETKAEIYPAKARTHKSVGKHPGIQWCLLFPEYFLINSLFTTRHAWSNWTYLLSIFSSVLQTGSKKKPTHPIVLFPDSLVGCNGTFLLTALQMVQISKPTSPRQAHRLVEGPPPSQTRTPSWRAPRQSRTQIPWGRDCQTGGKTSLYTVLKENK